MLQNHRGIPFTAARINPGGQAFSGTSMLELEFAEVSDPGKVREHNEDFIGHFAPASQAEVRSHGWLFALADGVGGQDRGEVASSTAVETLITSFRCDAKAGESSGALLQRLAQIANLKVYETGAATGPGGSSMCTTLVTCLLRYDRVTIAHVGDSRCYLIRRGQANMLTNDHTLVGEQVRMGLLSEREAAESERRHVLSRSLGANMFVNAEVNEHQILPGDLVLLSSDGFHGPVTAAEIATVTNRFPDLKQAATELVALARDKDGSDNISVQLIRIKSVERVGMYRGRPYKLR
ncbi:MAG TPA: protein phosphatase 2C domain-containing protein [Terriglobales bacterium]|nr:protein phosphatase 2C domain-containing protein [Terriglobales bacterium]